MTGRGQEVQELFHLTIWSLTTFKKIKVQLIYNIILVSWGGNLVIEYFYRLYSI